VSGTRSSHARQAATLALAELLPSGTLVELESGHFAHLEKPREVAALGV
jgi:pimeloyl-ACP methyl ester carboxylesterase